MESINKKVKQYPETVFDTFKLSLHGYQGASLRDRLAELSNLYAHLNKLVANAARLYELAEARRDEVESLAWSKVGKELKVTAKKIAAKSIEVEIDGEVTTLSQEEKRLSLYKYMSNRAKFTQKEMADQIDLGRTLLSWDKTEFEKTQY